MIVGGSITKNINQKYIAVLGRILLLAFLAVSAYAQPGKIKTQSDQRQKPPGPTVVEKSGDSVRAQFTTVPDIVGLTYDDAYRALYEAGLNKLGDRLTVTYVARPNSGVARGNVLTVSPAPGTLVRRDAVVKIQIQARDADKMGKGKLGPNDVERRMGWDLDTGSYEQIYRGADFVLRRIEETHPSTTGGSAYYESYIVFDASDGATLAKADDFRDWVVQVNSTGPESYAVYAGCNEILERGSKTSTRIHVFHLGQHLTDQERLICVRTSKGNVGAVYIKGLDYLGKDSLKDAADYVFEWALFEREPMKPIDSRPVKTKP